MSPSEQEPSAPADAPKAFAALGLRDDLQEALTRLGYEEPTPVQRAAIPALLEGRDVLGLAATGTGKTAAFALPMLQRLEKRTRIEPGRPQALVLAPTRELAMQVTEAISKYGQVQGVRAIAVYGGQEIIRQMRPLAKGVDVVVATPGRALDHLKRRSLVLDQVRLVVLDEADEMLDLGFAEDLEAILSTLPAQRQTALFSATLPPRIAQLSSKYLNDPVKVRIEAKQTDAGSLPKIEQVAFLVPRGKKDLALLRVISVEQPKTAIVFCRTRLEVERVTSMLNTRGVEAVALHGGMSQEQRDRVLGNFRRPAPEQGEAPPRLLVATDVAARGLDVRDLTHVINHDLPTSPEVYVHRIGRTGRAGKEGRALSLVEPKETRFVRVLEHVARTKIPLNQVPTSDDVLAKALERTTRITTEVAGGDVPAPMRTALAALVEQGRSWEELALGAFAALHAQLNPRQAGDDEALSVVASDRPRRPEGERGPPREGQARRPRPDGDRRAPRAERSFPEVPTVTLQISLGRQAGVRPQDIVGAIANEAGISSREVGRIDVQDRASYVDVAQEHQAKVLSALRDTTIRGRRFQVSLAEAGASEPRSPKPRREGRQPFDGGAVSDRIEGRGGAKAFGAAKDEDEAPPPPRSSARRPKREPEEGTGADEGSASVEAIPAPRRSAKRPAPPAVASAPRAKPHSDEGGEGRHDAPPPRRSADRRPRADAPAAEQVPVVRSEVVSERHEGGARSVPVLRIGQAPPAKSPEGHKPARPPKRGFGKPGFGGGPPKRGFGKPGFGDRPPKRSFDKPDRPFGKPGFEGDRPPKRSFDKPDRPFGKPGFEGDRPPKRSFDKPGRPFGKPGGGAGGDRPGKRSFDGPGRPSGGRPFGGPRSGDGFGRPSKPRKP